ncbi:hypothetical protein AZI98_08300 [Aeribacillus pallidus]|uniref:Uncharacterized protein n=1 Tax=Aeribacillus pallidus TaxID=33936 RepID=A0A165XX81_9BACI|nr:hypothetical protein AZI98_08300 [Aeribacillus pallidus]
MLAKPEIHHIKHLREKKGLSLSEIVRRTGFNWKTVKKYADGDISVRQKMKRKRGMMEEEGYGQSFVISFLFKAFKQVYEFSIVILPFSSSLILH